MSKAKESTALFEPAFGFHKPRMRAKKPIVFQHEIDIAERGTRQPIK